MSQSRRTARENRARAAVPEATVARLPLYLRVLTSLGDEGVETVSSDTLAAAAGVTPAKVRKDLSYLGSYGTRGVGYDVDVLLDRISTRLGLTEDRAVMLVGVGNLGHALARYGGFPARGFRIVALVDADPARAGEVVGGIAVRPVEDLERLIEDCQVTIGVICTPAGAAQQVCDRLVAAGVTSILNFAPVVLTVPKEVDVRKVDLAVELQILSFHEARKRPARVGGARVRPVPPGTLPSEAAGSGGLETAAPAQVTGVDAATAGVGPDGVRMVDAGPAIAGAADGEIVDAGTGGQMDGIVRMRHITAAGTGSEAS
ncbi:redox-sensing transcriptional repressor Rex [Frankia sp. CNm7]|uniref:Redox-sensing transcriptional repressor Rex n=1 Tax=Frankia nepalensis TaxID=1836974 RepID=A0A937RJJ6_9ACTN|nr:redox-sensing transcriptional repressor Rex [Frankia nepalensis]MBL7496023.1 redox-sensing transcriptional repressor Rex [Frankia nepalensis]MBL7514864.1 redox-sensing transcriptional repressor Rex [Frankia nepalensis]MBL7524522.1 redox-sensing transcriptional repressor Rex [Frankia nepalensis]MBL7631422.1 redox-sensing transcriptional repressor Rex [Frankia nepalensis]